VLLGPCRFQAALVLRYGREVLSNPEAVAALRPHLEVPSPLGVYLSDLGASSPLKSSLSSFVRLGSNEM
jgi:hypothetical protein